jgi:UDP-N-acetylglucosamine 3-dehydrogenase
MRPHRTRAGALVSALRVGVLGYGVMGDRHVRAILTVPGIALVGVADPSATMAPVPVVGSLPELLALGIDACVVATPTSDHLASAVALAAAGVHMLVEKPLALSPRECALISSAVDAAGVVALVGHVERFHPTIQELGSVVRRGALGALHQIATWYEGGWPRDTCGGVVLDLGVHAFDLTARLTGSPHRPSELTSSPIGDAPAGEAAVVSAVLGVLAVRHRLSWHAAVRRRQVSVYGADGTAEADLIAGTLTLKLAGRAQRTLVPARSDPLTAQFVAFCDAVLGRTAPVERAPVASLADAAHCVELACSVTPRDAVPSR